jgi:hypothetical protein
MRRSKRPSFPFAERTGINKVLVKNGWIAAKMLDDRYSDWQDNDCG